MSQEDRDRYKLAMHAMQSGVAMKMNYDPSETTPKHLRVGINGAMLEHSALATCLMDKGIFTSDEYEKALADFAEREAKMYQDWLNNHLGTNNITLG